MTTLDDALAPGLSAEERRNAFWDWRTRDRENSEEELDALVKLLDAHARDADSKWEREVVKMLEWSLETKQLKDRRSASYERVHELFTSIYETVKGTHWTPPAPQRVTDEELDDMVAMTEKSIGLNLGHDRVKEFHSAMRELRDRRAKEEKDAANQQFINRVLNR